MADEEFEKAFGSLAYAELEQKASGLFPYLVGFQMVQKSEDDSHAIGVFGFKVGDQWYYVPVFWLNAKIKGYDLLYIVGQDLFVPLQESWINYITNRKPNVLGESVEEEIGALGSIAPDFTIFSESPLTKGACYGGIDKDHLEPWCRPSLMYAKPSEKCASVKLDLEDILTRDCPELTASLLSTMSGNTKFAEAVYTFYGPSKVVGISSRAKSAMLRKEAVDQFVSDSKPQKVKYQYGTGAIGPDSAMSETAKERLMSGEAVIEDNRDEDEKSEVYAKPDFARSLVNPDSGMWNVLTEDGQFTDALVIRDPQPIGEAFEAGPASIVVDITRSNGFREFTIAGHKGVFARGMQSPDTKNPPKWEDVFEKFRNPKNVGVGDIGMFVGKGHTGSFPFWVLKSQTMSDGTKVLQVKPIDKINRGATHPFAPPRDGSEWEESERSAERLDAHRKPIGSYYPNEHAPVVRYKYHEYAKEEKNPGCCHKIIISNEPHRMHPAGTTLMVSTEDTKFIPFGSISVPGKDENGYYDWPKQWHEIKCGTMELGNSHDIDKYLMKSGMETMVVKSQDDFEVDLTLGYNTDRRMSKQSALKKMVMDYGLGERDARSILKKAFVDGRFEVLVKRAYIDATPPATYNDNYQALTTQPETQTEILDSGAPGIDPQESMRPIDPEAQQTAIEAANTGQKEVFDLSVLQGLIRVSNIDDVLDTVMKDIIVGNDKVGRILFMYYWHYDEFVTRYGDEDMRELEDTLRDVFKQTGELVLFLKQKSLEPGAADRLTVDIGDAPAGAGI